jgi:Protein of unknown function (DUF2442)
MSQEPYTHYPKAKEVAALPGHQLRVSFDNGETRLYDFSLHLHLDMFQLLKNDSLFRTVHVDAGGYGVSWTDDMDIAASELWLNGVPVEAPSAALAAH